MSASSITYFLGVFLLAVGIAVGSRCPAAVPITMGIGFILAAIVKFLKECD